MQKPLNLTKNFYKLKDYKPKMKPNSKQVLCGNKNQFIYFLVNVVKSRKSCTLEAMEV